ncbi:MAG: GNAT family N-acetyltransferase [Bacteroidetes bacterium]|nr:MAG: GNAT family N-acetyltransferase [Bacteroidota bacterium]
MEVKKLDKQEASDFRSLIEIFKTVFENDEPIASDEQLSWLLANPDFMVFVVKLNNKVIGGLTIYVLHSYYKTKPLAYVYDVGIAPNFQRRGLGKTLMETACNFCEINGFGELYVEAEADDTDAVNFYRKTAFQQQMNAMHFTYRFTHNN